MVLRFTRCHIDSGLLHVDDNISPACCSAPGLVAAVTVNAWVLTAGRPPRVCSTEIELFDNAVVVLCVIPGDLLHVDVPPCGCTDPREAVAATITPWFSNRRVSTDLIELLDNAGLLFTGDDLILMSCWCSNGPEFIVMSNAMILLSSDVCQLQKLLSQSRENLCTGQPKFVFISYCSENLTKILGTWQVKFVSYWSQNLPRIWPTQVSLRLIR